MEQFIYRVFAYVLIAIVIVLISFLIIRQNDNELLKNLNENYIIVYLPTVYRWVGITVIMGFSLFMALMIYLPSDISQGGGIGSGLIFGAFILLGLSIVIATYTWRIYVIRDEEYFVLRTSIGRTYNIKYEDIVCYINLKNCIIIKIAKKNFIIDNNAINLNYFIGMLQKQRVHKEKSKYKNLVVVNEYFRTAR